MKKSRKKVAYTQQSKRDLMRDIHTDAGRRAKILAAEKEANERLRSAVGNPIGKSGKPVARYVVQTIAAEHLLCSPGHSAADDFTFAADRFLRKLTYRPAYLLSIPRLWKLFLVLLDTANSNFASEIARGYESPFRWLVAGCVQRIDSEYHLLPNAIVNIEILKFKEKRKLIAVLRDGKRREIQPDEPPAPPLLLRAGTQVHEFVAPKDLAGMRQIGSARFLAEIKSGKRKLSPRPLKLLHEDTLINVAPPTGPDLVEICRDLKSWFLLLNKRNPA
jgi:hypothetical protein